MTKIKICGLTRECDIDYVNEAVPDYIGFVFYKKSKRYIEPEFALKLKNMLDPKIKAVGVFVNSPLDEVLKIVRTGAIDVIQLHGEEYESYIEKLKDLTDTPIIKAFSGTRSLYIETLADFALFDAPCGDKFGGLGKTFEWKHAPKVNKPVFLAGGINANNVNEAIKALSPYCIDVSSGVECHGKKDREKIIEIVDKVKNER